MNPYIIVEIGQAHDGSLGTLHSYIDAVSKTGVDAIKFQTHIADAESSPQEPFRVNFSYEDKTRFDYWKRMEFTFEQWIEIKKHCDEVGLEFISSPFSVAAVDLLEKLDVKKYKIGSGEVTNYLMLDKIAKTGKDIILSSGMSNFNELDDVFKFLSAYNNKISVLQCTTQYPTNPENLGLNVITELKNRYKVPVGLSDHSGKIYPSIAATTLGAEILEFHAVFDRRQFGPDSKSSLEIDEILTLVEGVSYISSAISNPIDKNKNSEFHDLKKIFEKTLSLNKSKRQGEIIKLEDLEAKKPALMGVSASDYNFVIGKKLARDLKKWDFINKSDLI
ncbi:N-acetylneuraminate synthase family protein [Flavobacteriales bacterium]|nr:N-acetylneuraminate synthase family protein [Flavobacteriales bacterium]